MKTGKLLCLLLLGVFLASEVDAQRAQRRRYKSYATVGLFVGGMHYQGDIDNNGFDWWNVFVPGAHNNVGNPLPLLRPQFGANVSYYWHPNYFGSFSFTQGWISANDDFDARPERKRRNLNFKSHVTDFSLFFGYNFYKRGRDYRFRPKYNPWIATGVTVFNFRPKGKPEDWWFDEYPELGTRFGLQKGKWFDLHELGTEGQYLNDPDNKYPKPYALTQIAIPIFFGVDIALSDRWQLTPFISLRKTFTDYLDDVHSQLYPDPVKLFNQNPLAVLFSDRSIYTDYGREVLLVYKGQMSINSLRSAYHAQQLEIQRTNQTKEKRGDPEWTDWYGVYGITLSYVISRLERCPRFR